MSPPRAAARIRGGRPPAVLTKPGPFLPPGIRQEDTERGGGGGAGVGKAGDIEEEARGVRMG